MTATRRRRSCGSRPEPPDARRQRTRGRSGWARRAGVTLVGAARPRTSAPSRSTRSAGRRGRGPARSRARRHRRRRRRRRRRDRSARPTPCSARTRSSRRPRGSWPRSSAPGRRAGCRVPPDRPRGGRPRVEARRGARRRAACPASASERRSHPAEAHLELQVDLAGDDAGLDRRSPVSAPDVATRAGLHAVVVTAERRPGLGDWVEVPPGGSTLALEPPRTAPCSGADLARARTAAAALRADGVRCRAVGRLAAPGTSAGTRFASRRAGRPLRRPRRVARRRGDASRWMRPARLSRHGRSSPGSRWPAWATWALAGAGVAVAAGVTAVVASGALSGGPPRRRTLRRRRPQESVTTPRLRSPRIAGSRPQVLRLKLTQLRTEVMAQAPQLDFDAFVPARSRAQRRRAPRATGARVHVHVRPPVARRVREHEARRPRRRGERAPLQADGRTSSSATPSR